FRVLGGGVIPGEAVLAGEESGVGRLLQRRHALLVIPRLDQRLPLGEDRHGRVELRAAPDPGRYRLLALLEHHMVAIDHRPQSALRLVRAIADLEDAAGTRAPGAEPPGPPLQG